MSSDAVDGAVRLCRAEEVAEGQAQGFPAGDGKTRIIVVHREGRYVGWRDSCPHGYIPLGVADERGYFNTSRTHLVCYGHGALFEPLTGLCVWGPCEGKTLRPVSLAVRDGEIWLTTKIA